ncbi:hypothetical protein [Microlunatus sp. Gsoil 973]|uniref:hypothetical protein n=1 Tax=Microlunatus sp. Gsoil 973 TaxID=2672569 RepID=UPI0012B446F0|nr:hypothetical protein [Microlunatus sp. Gsoil 973]QGN31846.1 hypothetical protein GJV80_02370 [Microlunatus sp. Gsoil 973]
MSSYSGIGDRIVSGFGMRFGRWQDSARRARAGINAPKPPVRVETGRAAPDWVFRIGCLAFGVGTIIALAPGVVLIVILSALLAVVLLRPSTGTGSIFCCVLGLFQTINPTSPNSAAQVAILALAPALWMLAGVIADLPLRTRVELAVLRTPAVRYLVLQLIGQPVLVGAQLLQAHRTGISASFAGAFVLAIVVIMAVVAWLLFPRFTREE